MVQKLHPTFYKFLACRSCWTIDIQHDKCINFNVVFNIFIKHDLHQTKRKRLTKPFKRTYSHINLLKQFSTFHFQFSIYKLYCAPLSFTAPKNLSGLSTPFCTKYQINISCKFKGIKDENFSIACITMSACSDFCVVIEESAYIYL